MKLWHFIGAVIATLATAPITSITLPFATLLSSALVIYPASSWMLKAVDDWHLKWSGQ